MACCARDQLCDRCLHDNLAQLRGVAACRGEYWARCTAMRTSQRRPWPDYEGRCAQIARDKVSDLGRDERLQDALARLVVEWAARWWEQNQPASTACRSRHRSPTRSRRRPRALDPRCRSLAARI
jgi:hypothetical protein